MPLRDGSGPQQSKDAKTGRGLGNRPGQGQGAGQGAGRGQGRGKNGGQGRRRH